MKYAIINRQGPYSSAKSTESLDLVLAAGSFGFEVGVFFSDDGVYQLISQASANIERKNVNKTFKALPFYDINDLFVLSTSLITRNIKTEQLNIPVTIVEPDEWQAVLRTYPKIISF